MAPDRRDRRCPSFKPADVTAVPEASGPQVAGGSRLGFREMEQASMPDKTAARLEVAQRRRGRMVAGRAGQDLDGQGPNGEGPNLAGRRGPMHDART
jgi:hypothetical protein